MPSLDDQQLGQYIDEVTQATKDGLISWTTANPTTYVWDKTEEPAARLSLQQVLKTELGVSEKGTIIRNKESHYVFQVFELNRFGLIARKREEIDGSDNGTLNAKLRIL